MLLIEKLERLVDDVGALHNKLVLLIGAPGSGKTKLLTELAISRETPTLSVGTGLGAHLAALSYRRRQLQSMSILRDIAGLHTRSNLLLIDNIEILFDRSLKLDPLGFLKQQAHSKRVVAVWPGESTGSRLTYAKMEHAEHQNYSNEGMILLKLES
jgi:hypothetical protein